ncbi:MAG TPA: hypothetical protein VMK65_03405, partial [Longimicrobiales bacterium]|nr:hypothetical protein [Longimicrobiales bacterium]
MSASRADELPTPLMAPGRARQAGILHLLRPKWRAHQRRLAAGGTVARAALLAFVGVVFFAASFGILYRMLRYFRGAEGIGEVLAVKLLGLILLAFLSILLLSNIITALSAFFLAHDLELHMAAPVDSLRIYGARLTETVTHSSWMVALMMLPVLAAYGVTYGGGLTWALVAIVTLAAFFILPAVTGSALTLVLVNLFPARRARDLLALIALFGAAALVVLVRLLRPEQLARPEGFRSLVGFVAALETPTSAWLPSEWAANAIMAPLGSGSPDLFPLLLLTSTAAAFVVMGAWLHERLYREGFSRAQEGARLQEVGSAGRAWIEPLLGAASSPVRAVMAKDIRTFFRDTTQWSQLILLAVLVVVYVYNIKVLPLWSGEEVGFFLTNVVSFLNLGLAGFVLTAIAARFLFPAVSLEGRHLWLLKHAPLDLRRLVAAKFIVGVAPLLVLAVALSVGTNLILRVGPFMMAVSVGTTV